MSPQSVPIIGTDAANSFEDLSGLISKTAKTSSFSENPYDVLIDACNNDPVCPLLALLLLRGLYASVDLSNSGERGQVLIQRAYETHRITRNAQQRAKLLSPDFAGVIVDKTLQELEYLHGAREIPELAGQPKRSPVLVDPRNCLVFWARPTSAVQDLIGVVQEKLRQLAPGLCSIDTTDGGWGGGVLIVARRERGEE